MTQLNSKAEIVSFVEEQGYTIQDQGPLLILQDEDGLNIFAVIDDTQIEFMVALCRISDLDLLKLEEDLREDSRSKYGDFAVLFRDRFGRSERQTDCAGRQSRNGKIWMIMNFCLR